MAAPKRSRWRCRDRTKLFENEITIAGSVTDQQFKLFQGVVLRVIVRYTGGHHSAFNYFVELMNRFNTDKFLVHGKLKKDGFVLERIILQDSGTTVLLFDVNEKSLPKLNAAISDRSLGNKLISAMVGNEVEDCPLELGFINESELENVREDLNLIKRLHKLQKSVYNRGRTGQDRMGLNNEG